AKDHLLGFSSNESTRRQGPPYSSNIELQPCRLEVKEEFREEVPYRPTTQRAKRLKPKARRRCNRPKDGSPSVSAVPTNCAE
ncbi:hypothetical protein H5410_045589, partial [Solanum commersonii]